MMIVNLQSIKMESGKIVEMVGDPPLRLSINSFHAALRLHQCSASLTNSINAESHPLHVELSDLGVRLVVYLPGLAEHPAAAHVRAPVLTQEVQDGGEHLKCRGKM